MRSFLGQILLPLRSWWYKETHPGNHDLDLWIEVCQKKLGELPPAPPADSMWQRFRERFFMNPQERRALEHRRGVEILTRQEGEHLDNMERIVRGLNAEREREAAKHSAADTSKPESKS